MICKLSFLLVTCLTVLCGLNVQCHAGENGPDGNSESEVAAVDLSKQDVAETKLIRTKRFIGGIVGAAVSVAGMVMSRKDAKRAAERYEESMKFQLEQLCDAICVTEWEQWSVCTKHCGGGTRKRTRRNELPGRCSQLSNFKCRHSLVQQERCNEGCPHGGTPNQKGCSCQPGWLGVCCLEEVICEYPGKPRNGLTYGTFPAKFRSVVTFACDPGYVLVGREQILCQNNKKWNGPVPSCQRIICEMPRQNSQVEILNPQQRYHFGEEVVYQCKEGYRLVGPTTRQCKAGDGTRGRWTSFDPKCPPVRCDDLPVIAHGERKGDVFTYGASVKFSCIEGYRLEGSSTLKCLASGRWLGIMPKCEQIVCEAPIVPKNGEVFGRSLTFGSVLTFECLPGYRLEGNVTIRCEGNGKWSSVEPTCEAAMCGNPGTPENGAKDGSVYYYPNNITFSCFTGYTLKGVDLITCQEDGTWSNRPPKCEACPLNTYMEENRAGICIPCPRHTHTLTTASSSHKQCVCVHGYTGPPGGPCTEIRCPVLTAPAHGSLKPCNNTLASSCHFTCAEGHILDKGSSMRVCQENGEWDGKQPSCSPCPKNTYKSDVRSCLPCPLHSRTAGIAQQKSGCICDAGYKGPNGGPCQDINECEENDGRGPCQDICENRDGFYKCGCSIPGYVIDPANQHTCIVDKQCANLTRTDAPDNGGLVCHWYREENSQQCSVKCNPGYEFPSRTNDYETCGPTTGYIWSYRREDQNATIDPCVEEFFPEFRVEVASAYFVADCESLNDEQKKEVMEVFAQKLNENGVCKRRTRQVCDIKDMAIICGRRTVRRRKRDTGEEEEVKSMDLDFNVNAVQFQQNIKDCPNICRFLRIPGKYCRKLCIPTYKRFLQAAVRYAKRQLEVLYQQRREALLLRAAQREFQPEGVETSDVIIECETGMMADGEKCIPCVKGTAYNATANRCDACAAGTYQPLDKQLYCVPCPTGTTTGSTGSVFCQVCPKNRYGEQCKLECDCVNGDCDPRTGECKCHSGWEGSRCNIDTPGCRDGGCFNNVVCTDVPAPGTGFQCASCPRGFTGDGATCLAVKS